MPRKPRDLEPDGTYHVISRGNNRARIFHCDDDFRTYLHIVRRAKDSFGFSLFHYALMSNHVHLIVKTEERSPLPVVMKNINERYAIAYKRSYEHTGHVWTNRFKSFFIGDDGYLLTCGSYVELNPVRAGIVDDPADYHWSSYRHHALGERQDLISESLALEMLAGTKEEQRKEYRRIVAMWQEKK